MSEGTTKWSLLTIMSHFGHMRFTLTTFTTDQYPPSLNKGFHKGS